MDGICEEEHIAWHGRTHNNIIHAKPIRENSGAVYLHPVIKDEYTDRSSRIQRAMYQSIYGELNKADVWNLQYSLRVKLFPNLYMAQVPGEEIHNSFKLMKQISFNVGIIHLITKLCTSKIVSNKANALCSHCRKPTLSVLAKQQHCSHCDFSIGSDET